MSEGQTTRDLYLEARRAAAALAERHEQLTKLVPTREGELTASREEIPQVRLSERMFRGFYEKCRDVREILEESVDDFGS